jgi:hypothetical protein
MSLANPGILGNRPEEGGPHRLRLAGLRPVGQLLDDRERVRMPSVLEASANSAVTRMCGDNWTLSPRGPGASPSGHGTPPRVE